MLPHGLWPISPAQDPQLEIGSQPSATNLIPEPGQLLAGIKASGGVDVSRPATVDLVATQMEHGTEASGVSHARPCSKAETM